MITTSEPQVRTVWQLVLDAIQRLMEERRLKIADASVRYQQSSAESGTSFGNVERFVAPA